MKLTGRKRYRALARWGRPALLVLQVEVSGLIVENVGGSIECERQTWWRDARLEDVSKERELVHGVAP